MESEKICRLQQTLPTITTALQAYGRELDEAYEWCLKYKQSRKVRRAALAWCL